MDKYVSNILRAIDPKAKAVKGPRWYMSLNGYQKVTAEQK